MSSSLAVWETRHVRNAIDAIASQKKHHGASADNERGGKARKKKEARRRTVEGIAHFQLRVAVGGLILSGQGGEQ